MKGKLPHVGRSHLTAQVPVKQHIRRGPHLCGQLNQINPPNQTGTNLRPKDLLFPHSSGSQGWLQTRIPWGFFCF